MLCSTESTLFVQIILLSLFFFPILYILDGLTVLSRVLYLLHYIPSMAVMRCEALRWRRGLSDPTAPGVDCLVREPGVSDPVWLIISAKENKRKTTSTLHRQQSVHNGRETAQRPSRIILLISASLDVQWHLITTRKRSLRRLCFYTCLSVHSGGKSTWAGTPWDQVHPPEPGTHTSPPGPGTPSRAGTPPDQVHHIGSSACWETRATSGR